MAVAEARILRLHERGRAVIDIEQDRIVTVISGTPDDLEYISNDDLDSRIIQQGTVHPTEELAVPCHDLWQQFSDFHGGSGTDEFEHPPEAVTQAKAADEHAGAFAIPKTLAGQLSQQQFRSGGGGTHELTSVELYEILAIVLVERELRSIRGEGLAKFSKGFQGRLEKRCEIVSATGEIRNIRLMSLEEDDLMPVWMMLGNDRYDRENRFWSPDRCRPLRTHLLAEGSISTLHCKKVLLRFPMKAKAMNSLSVVSPPLLFFSFLRAEIHLFDGRLHVSPG